MAEKNNKRNKGANNSNCTWENKNDVRRVRDLKIKERKGLQFIFCYSVKSATFSFFEGCEEKIIAELKFFSEQKFKSEN